MADDSFETVKVKIARRNGCFYISSDDVPGLWLWGKNLEQLLKNTAPAIRTLYKYNRGVDVEVESPALPKMLLLFVGWIKLFRSLKESYRVHISGEQKLTSVHVTSACAGPVIVGTMQDVES